MGSGAAVFASLLLGSALAGCAREGELGAGGEAPVLELLRFQQADRVGVALNETLVFLFSTELDRGSLTPSSFRIEDAAGREARGELRQRGATLQFVPDLPLRADLTDGGLLPGREYTVTLLGFPAPDGVRGRRGEPLARTIHLHFHTASPDENESVFLDTFPSQLHVLVCERVTLGQLEPIRLTCGEALDPTTVDGREFALLDASDLDGAEPRRIPLRARLEANGESGARLALQPIFDPSRPEDLRALDPGEYFLIVRPEAGRVASLGGRPVEAAWEGTPEPFQRLRVVAREPRTRRFEFDDVALRSPRELEGFDGTAHWGGDGSVRVRYPAAAGDGADGEVRDLPARVAALGDAPDGLDVHATRLVLEEGADLDLSAIHGTVILRAQGELVLAGSLERRMPPTEGPAPDGAGKVLDALTRERRHLDELLKAALEDPAATDRARAISDEREALDRRRTLSAFLAEAQERGAPWTVLVAGGDVRIPGKVAVEGSLVIVAGGWVRVAGSVDAGEVRSTHEGGGNYTARTSVRSLDLALDAPAENPLVAPLRLAVLSDPIRPSGGVRTWIGLKADAHQGTGRVSVRAVGERELGLREAESWGPVDDVSLLEGCQTLRLWIELAVPAGPGPWDPPSLDAVDLSWTQPDGGEEEPNGALGSASAGR